MGFFSDIFGGDIDIPKPELFIDPTLEKIKERQADLGLDFLGGKFPDFLKPIGEIGGTTFENLLNKTVGNITSGVNQDISRRGLTGRGGLGTTAIAQTIGNIIPGLREQERRRALTGRQALFTEGRGLLSGASGLGLKLQDTKNRFNEIISGIKQQEEEQKQKAKASIVTGLLGETGNLFPLAKGFLGGLGGGQDTTQTAGQSASGFSALGDLDFDVLKNLLGGTVSTV